MIFDKVRFKLKKKLKIFFIILLVLPILMNLGNLQLLFSLMIEVIRDFFYDQKLYVVGIMSSIGNFEERQSVRNTWAKLIDPKVGEIKFLIGSRPCKIPKDDRVTPQLCLRWSPRLPSIADLETVFSMTEQTKKKVRVVSGFTFIVKHRMSVEMLGISSSLRRGRKEGVYRVELHDSQRSEKVISASFIISGDEPTSGFLWKKVPKISFDKGFEGEIKINSDDDYRNLNCTQKFKTDGAVIVFEIVDIKGFYHKFQADNCPIATFLYKINDIQGLQNFINETSSRQKVWEEEINMVKKRLLEEEKTHSDFLTINTVDVYSNLPVKLKQFLRWSTLEDRYKNLIKTDDDVFLDIRKVEMQLKMISRWDWWSCFKVGWPPPNSGKWRDRLTDESTYPKFPSGSGYVLKSSIAKKALSRPMTNAGEDVSLGIWLYDASPVDLIDSKCFWACDSQCNKNPCNVPDLKVDQMYQVWQEYNQCGEICRCSEKNL